MLLQSRSELCGYFLDTTKKRDFKCFMNSTMTSVSVIKFVCKIHMVTLGGSCINIK